MPMGNGIVGTAGNPSPQAAPAPAKPFLKPSRPNSGGTIVGRGQTVNVPSDPGYNDRQQESGPQSGGWLQKGNLAVHVLPNEGPQSTGIEMENQPKAESSNPLNNATQPKQIEGAKVDVAPITPPPAKDTLDAGKALGITQRGNASAPGKDVNAPAPKPDVDQISDTDTSATAPDAQPQDSVDSSPQSVESDLKASADETQQHLGGHGAYQRSFSNPQSAQIYHDYYSKLTGDKTPRPGSSPAKPTGTPRDNGDAMSGDDNQA